MSRNRYLFNKQGDCYLPAEDLTLVELTKEGEHFFLGACTDPQVNLMNPAQVVSKVPVNVAKLHAEHADLLAVAEMLSLYDPLEFPTFYSVINKAKEAVAKTKGVSDG